MRNLPAAIAAALGALLLASACGGADGGPPAAADIAFISLRDGNSEIYVMTPTGTSQSRLTDSVPAEELRPVWSPDGGRMAFASEHDGNMEIYVMNADGSGQTRLTDNPAADRDPSWSPDGTRIAFLSDRNRNDNSFPPGPYEIYVMNADGSGLTNLTDNGAVNFGPAWSPGSPLIAFHSSLDGDYEVYVADADGSGSGPARLTDNTAIIDSDPAWSPDGNRIAFVSCHVSEPNQYGVSEGLLCDLYLMNADGSSQTRLTNSTRINAVFDATWSPDGSRIAFSSDRDGNLEIYVANAGGSGPTRLTNNPADDGEPVWSPDSSRIAFSSERDGNYEIYVMNAAGSGQTNLTRNPALDRYPVWSPTP